MNDFAPVTMVASTSILMAVHPSVPAHTVRGLIETAKTRPQTIANYRSAGTGTVFHLTGELFKRLAGLQLQCSCCLAKRTISSRRGMREIVECPVIAQLETGIIAKCPRSSLGRPRH